MLEEEFDKFVADYKPEDSGSIPAIKTFFKAYLTSNPTRDMIDGKQFTGLATNAEFSIADYRAVPARVPGSGFLNTSRITSP